MVKSIAPYYKPWGGNPPTPRERRSAATGRNNDGERESRTYAMGGYQGKRETERTHTHFDATSGQRQAAEIGGKCARRQWRSLKNVEAGITERRSATRKISEGIGMEIPLGIGVDKRAVRGNRPNDVEYIFTPVRSIRDFGNGGRGQYRK